MPLVVLVILLLLAPAAAADQASDYRAVHKDWEQDGKITPCHWTQPQLENARAVSDGNPDDTYNGFPDKVDAEIARWRGGDCAAKIKRVSAKRERVRLVNRTSKRAKVGGMRLRDRQGHTIKLRRGLRIGAGKSIVVKSGKRAIWDDRGDIARLVAKDGTVVSQFGYGRFRNTKRF